MERRECRESSYTIQTGSSLSHIRTELQNETTELEGWRWEPGNNQCGSGNRRRPIISWLCILFVSFLTWNDDCSSGSGGIEPWSSFDTLLGKRAFSEKDDGQVHWEQP